MKKVLFCAVVLVFGLQAHTLTLAEKKKLATEKAELGAGGDRTFDKFKTHCGQELPVTFDEAMMVSFMAANTSVAAYCDTPRSIMSDMCDDATAKKEITSKVKKVVCKLGKEGTLEMKLSGGTLTYTVGLNASNQDEKTKTWLESNL